MQSAYHCTIICPVCMHCTIICPHHHSSDEFKLEALSLLSRITFCMSTNYSLGHASTSLTYTGHAQALLLHPATCHVLPGGPTCIPRIAVPLQQQQVARGRLPRGAAAPHAEAAGVAAEEALQLPPVCVSVVQELRASAAVCHQTAHLR